MKRDSNLVPLSWDHHTGLTVAKRIRERIPDPSQHAVLCDYVLAHWRAHLATHFRQEEDLLQPILHRTEEGQSLNSRLLREHEEIRGLIHALERGGEDLQSVLKQISMRLRAHIQFEENEYFAEVERAASREELAALGEILHREHKENDPRMGL